MFILLRNLFPAVLIGASLTAPLSVTAQDRAGMYLSVYGGASSMGSTTVSESRPALANLEGKASFGNGTGLGGAFGYRYGNGWAAELAWDYRSHDLKRIGATAVDGDFASTVLFVNGYYRFAKVGGVRPFLGAGLGYITEIDMDITRGGTEQEYSRRGGVATQLIVGGEVDLTANWSLTADLRWSQMGSAAFKSTKAGAALGNRPKYQPTSLQVGVTYRF
jgi:outer membrane protein W